MERARRCAGQVSKWTRNGSYGNAVGRRCGELRKSGSREAEGAAVLSCQQAGQMALDTRTRSTCRRLTKAIPASDMTEACHGDRTPVHRYPYLGQCWLAS
ncbi:Hypothetical protein SCLAV_4900 [Streptomyces clavuligerus]|uniref:Uncharacterized protein n=1 Tax=Streptomyces clavuligerus TaxID=1901 RepID=E2PVY3_STRCL|nr:Hypothetical protein SCLAV_4900 [Streptomyces clavuligerus]